MTQAVETSVVELDLVSCQTCDLVFVASERRQTCPVCGGEATGPYLEYVLDDTGLHPKNGSAVLPAGEPAEDVRPDAEAGPIAESEAAEEPRPAQDEVDWVSVFVAHVSGYLHGTGSTEDDLRTVLEEKLGAKPRVARVTVQRLTAVRDTIATLTAPTEEETDAPAEEVKPEETAEKPSEPESAPESV